MAPKTQAQLKPSLPAPIFRNAGKTANTSRRNEPESIAGNSERGLDTGVTFSPKLKPANMTRPVSPLQFMCQEESQSSATPSEHPGSVPEKMVRFAVPASPKFGTLPGITGDVSVNLNPLLVGGHGDHSATSARTEENTMIDETKGRRTSERLRKQNERSQNGEEANQEYYEDYSQIVYERKPTQAQQQGPKQKIPLLKIHNPATSNVASTSTSVPKKFTERLSPDWDEKEMAKNFSNAQYQKNTNLKRGRENVSEDHSAQRRKIDQSNHDREATSTKTATTDPMQASHASRWVVPLLDAYTITTNAAPNSDAKSAQLPAESKTKEPRVANPVQTDRDTSVTLSSESDKDENAAGPSNTMSAQSTQAPSELHPVAKQIFKARLQHRVLRPFYSEFAQQEWVPQMTAGKLVPYLSTKDLAAREVCTARYGPIMRQLNGLEQTALVRMMTFEKHEIYINITRSAPQNIRTGRELDACLVHQGSHADRPVTFVCPGFVTSSELVRGSGEVDNFARKLYVQLMSQDFEYASAFICTLMGDNVVHCPIFGGSLCLQSKKQKSQGSVRKNPSPNKRDLNRFSRTKSKRNERPRMPLPVDAPFRLYHHDMPIYDGRPNGPSGIEGFRPESSNWDNLSAMPRYEGEIPVGSLVIPGFTLAGPWNIDTNPSHPTAHFNLMFAIVLSTLDGASEDSGEYEDPDDSGIETDCSYDEQDDM
ncbi:hypothetical protein VNI00_011052 [Paramarasmius palmivorus]|uniref:Uncharacterized protein n=1 Tax=Paramarasmius palmivorus TaxID=297713 RepID=A0AAW0CF15_9AGAR